MSAYHEALKKLNPEQRDAVVNTDGAVMVIAGPGTGKTQVIASRIAYILENTDTNPKNILCLTYTDAGAVAMKTRLIEFIGPTGHDVKISTFHGFCNEVIQENQDYFGIKEIEPIDDLERVKVLKQIIDSFDKDNILKRFKGEVYYDLNNLKNLFSIMRKEDITYEFIKQKVDEHLDSLQYNPDFIYKVNRGENKKGDINQKKVDEVKEKLDKLLAGAKEYELYKKINREKGFYDFDDMIIWVKEAFEKHEFMLRRYQEKYQYILVDEYQDTNGAQNEIVTFLANYFDNPNLFVVGDDDQSIYRFQGANMENIKEFQERYRSHIKLISMTVNYRSSQSILNASMHLIEKNRSRILSGNQKLLTAGNTKRTAHELLPNILEFDNTIAEGAFITDYISKAFQKGEKLSDIAVIYRNHKDAEDLINFLQKKDIPVNATKSVNILNEPIFQNILNLLKYFDSEMRRPYSNNSELFNLLICPWFNINHLTISNFSYWFRAEWRKQIGSESADKHRKYHWRYLLNHVKNGKDYLSEDEIYQLEQVAEKLENLLSKQSEYTLPQYIGVIMDECGVLEWIMNSKQQVWNLEVYRAFFDFVKKETKKNPKLSFKELFDTLQTMIDEELNISLSKTLIDKNGVNFLTAHSSKGLEFETVFILNCVEGSWNKKARNYGFSFPPNLFAKSETLDEDDLEESRRLFYVAMTRAEKNLFITYALETENEKKLISAKFVSELLDTENIVHFAHTTVPTELSVNYEFEILKQANSKPGKIHKDWVAAILENYQLSTTDMDAYLECPVKYFYEKILRIPAAKTASMSFGSAIHEALERYIKDSQSEKRGIQFEELLVLYEKALDGQRDSLTDTEHKNFVDLGRKTLKALYDKKLTTYDLSKIQSELNVNARIGDDVLIKGMMDMVQESANELQIFDYKTGKYNKDKFKRPNDEKTKDENIKLYGGSYWRQAVFYALLMENSEKYRLHNVHKVVFDFVETYVDECKDEIVVITPPDKDFVKQLASDTYHKILNQEFEVGCQKPECKWCSLEIK